MAKPKGAQPQHRTTYHVEPKATAKRTTMSYKTHTGKGTGLKTKMSPDKHK